MNEQLREQLFKVLGSMTTAANDAANFALEQVPLVAQEVVRYQLWSGVVWLVLCIAAQVAVLKVAKYLSNKCNDELAITLAVFGSILPVIIGLINLQLAIKAAVAPRLVILDYVQELAK